MSDFFKKINYSAANEDGESERVALSPVLKNGKALVITGSGSRPLELLIAEPDKVISIDFNPTQNFLLELKIAAIQKLDYSEFSKFLGLRETSNRKETYRELRELLSSEARVFWDKREESIENGILYCGSWEYYLNAMAQASKLFRGQLVNDILYAPSLEIQRDLWNKRWENFSWKLFLKMAGFRPLWKYVVKEPGIDLVPKELDIEAELHHRFHRSANQLYFRKCAYAWLLLNGKYNPDESLPCHLEEKYYPLLKEQIDKIEVVTAPLGQYLNSTSEKIDAYSISDFGSYAPPAIYKEIWQSIVKSASRNARVCEREFLVPQDINKVLPNTLERDIELENQLELNDRSFIYKFKVGNVIQH